jgi:integrase
MRPPRDRGRATAATQTRLVDPDETPDRKPHSRPHHVQSGDRHKLRGCDLVAIRVEDVAAGGYTADRATVRQRKTGRPVRFELSEQTRQAVDDYLKATGKRPGEFLFTGRRAPNRNMTTRQYAQLVSEWIGSGGLDPRLFETHSLRRTKATLIYRRTGNLRAVQLLLEMAT